MTEPWFDPNLYAWIPGTALGIAGGILGSLGGVLAPRGRARGVVLGFYGAVLCVTAVLLMAGLFALYRGQPYGVWYGLMLPGVLGTAVFGALLPVILKRYREAEERRLMAHDI
jgi:hypothetical protein